MVKAKKDPACFFCPECGSEDVITCEEILWHINTNKMYCHSVKTHDDDARVNCRDCDWDGFKRDLIDKTKEVKAAEKLKADKEYKQYLKLKAKFEKEQP